MSNPQPNDNPHTFQSLYAHLLTHSPHPGLFCAPTPFSKPLTAQISALALHPTLETVLHILNHDLPSAHFLVRHMQGPPKYEGMFLHGILHRIECDFDNARAWYENVSGSEVFAQVWPEGIEEAKAFVGKCEGLRQRGLGEREGVEGRARAEVERCVGFCRRVFGEGRWEDVSGEWVRMSEEKRKQAESMAIGWEGWRQF